MENQFSKTFNGEKRMEIICLACKNTNEQIIQFTDFNLPIKGDFFYNLAVVLKPITINDYEC